MAALRRLFHFKRTRNSNLSQIDKHQRSSSQDDKSLIQDNFRSICTTIIRVNGFGASSLMRVELFEQDDQTALLALYATHSMHGGEPLVCSLRVQHAERVEDKDKCLMILGANEYFRLYLHFLTDSDLYYWLEELYTRCPTSGVVNYDTFQHNMHIRTSNDRSGFTGFPLSLTRYFERFMQSNRHSDLSSAIMTDSDTAPGEFKSYNSQASSADTELITPTASRQVTNPDIVEEDSIATSVKYPSDHIGYTPVSPLKGEQLVSTDLLSLNITKSPALANWPRVRDLTPRIKRLHVYPAASGGCSDIYKGEFKVDGRTVRVVGIKAMRSMMASRGLEKKFTKRLTSEINVWQRLHHPNVVELLGICHGFGEHPALVSWWYDNGHVMDYLEDMEDEATLALRLRLILDMAKGLAYLHSFSSPVIHGDLKGANLLVDNNGTAMLTDFGLSTVIESVSESSRLDATSKSSSGNFGCSVRWMAVEFVCLGFDDPHARFSTASDVYSFGSTMLEILSGKMPYYTRTRDAQVLVDIFNGVRHQRHLYPRIENGIWNLMECCWMDIPNQRPSMGQLIQLVEQRYLQERRIVQ